MGTFGLGSMNLRFDLLEFSKVSTFDLILTSKCSLRSSSRKLICATDEDPCEIYAFKNQVHMKESQSYITIVVIIIED